MPTIPAYADQPPAETATRPAVSSAPRTSVGAPPGAEVPPGSAPVAAPRAPRPSSARPSGARPAPQRLGTGRLPATARDGGRTVVRPGTPRKARLTVSRVDPWGVLKLSFLLSVALGIVYIVAAAVVWNIVDGMGVFRDINELVQGVDGEGSEFDVYQYVGLERVLSLTTVIAVANVVILTLLATLFAVLYNLGSTLVGGTRVTLTDE